MQSSLAAAAIGGGSICSRPRRSRSAPSATPGTWCSGSWSAPRRRAPATATER